jgi:adenosylcobinamide kinase / adenosylcobinamide-phosphate guanylyltransferase
MQQLKELILGGVRSGKSRLAEQRAHASAGEVLYVATARDLGDAELRERIAQHRARRPPAWRLIEEPIGLAAVLQAHAAPERCLIIECLTLWLTNLLCASPAILHRERAALQSTLPGLAGHIIVVSNETGLGVIPADELSRRFVDEMGALHQWLAAACERVTLMVAGLPLTLKDALPR